MAEPTFDPSQIVLLHSGTGRDVPPTLAMPDPPLTASHVSVSTYKPHEIVLQAEMEQPGYVVLGDTWYPGWQALLDGKSIPIERANLAFRALYVPQGSHRLHLIYRPASYLWGLSISLGTIAMIVLTGLLRTRWIVRATRDAKSVQPYPN